MKIAIAQIKAVKGNIEKNIENHITWIKRAIKENADLIVFPELSLTGYEPELARLLATNQNDKRLDCFEKLSNENNITICAGLPTKIRDDIYISMIIFRPGTERTTYSKQFLFRTEVPFFKPGKNPLVFQCGNEIIAPAICYELSVNEHNEYAARNKATVYMASVLNSVSGVDADLIKLSEIANKYKMITFMANYIGESGGYLCAGKSSVWNKNGELIMQLDDKEDGLIICDTKTMNIVCLNNITD